ncbi:MAG: glycosyltransferase family 2 protein [Motilibacteraceae bacterium]
MPPSLVALDVLLPTSGGTERLAPVLSGLLAQSTRGFRVVVSDSAPETGGLEGADRGALRPGRDLSPDAAWDRPGVRQAVADLRRDGVRVELHSGRLPGGEAGQLAFLLDRTRARQVLLLGDDVVLDPQALGVLSRALDQLRCGVVGMVPVRGGQRPAPGAPSPRRWVRGVLRETLGPGSEEWQERCRVVPPRATSGDPTWWPYRAGSLRGCALYRRRALLAVGGFAVAPTRAAGEPCSGTPGTPGTPDTSDAHAATQVKVMARDGAAAIAPSAATRLSGHRGAAPAAAPADPACGDRSRVRHEA